MSSLAFEALSEDKLETDRRVGRIVNASKTCAPLIAAVIATESEGDDIVKDMTFLLHSAKKLILTAKKEIDKISEIEHTHNEIAAVNHLCLTIAAANWADSQEIFEEWDSVLLTAIKYQDISAEYEAFISIDETSEIDFSSNLVASTEIANAIISTLNKGDVFPEDIFVFCLKRLHLAVQKTLKMTVNFHLDESQLNRLRPEIIHLSSKIFAASIMREYKFMAYNNRAIKYGSTSSNSSTTASLNFEEIARYFEMTLKSIVISIMNNSQMTK